MTKSKSKHSHSHVHQVDKSSVLELSPSRGLSIALVYINSIAYHLEHKFLDTSEVFLYTDSFDLSFFFLFFFSYITSSGNHYWLVVKSDSWLVTTRPATLAEVRVARTPEIRAETARRATSPPRVGASWLRIPIWIPREPMLPKPQRA